MKQIMLVDDESDQILSIKIALENLYKNEFTVIPAENGEKCINILKQGTIPDIILLDIMMPNMSGWEVYDKIRDNPDWKNIPILFLTGRTDRIAENAGKYLGDDFIEKPVEIKELRERINRVLDR
jgi:putative two-component system response regulator